METPRGSCSGQFWACWDLKVRQNHTWGERELIPEKVRKETEYLRERAKQESIRVEWTGNSTLHTKNSCCLKPITEKQCTCLYCGSSRRKPGTTRPCKAVLCLLGPWVLLHWAQCQVVTAVAEGGKMVLWEVARFLCWGTLSFCPHIPHVSAHMTWRQCSSTDPNARVLADIWRIFRWKSP